jgi:hypothetical protein
MEKRVVSCSAKGKIEIKPDFLPQVKVDKNHLANKRKLRIAGENASFFAGYIYEAIFKGVAVRPNEKYPDEEGMEIISSPHFRPDHVLSTPQGTIATEIKMTSLRSSQPFCSNSQFFHYYRYFLDCFRSGEEAPSVNYAFFKYGAKEPLKIGKFTNIELVQTLSKEIRNLTVVPLNLAIFLFSRSRLEEPDQTNWRVVSRGYWRPRGLDITDLHKCAPLESVEKINRRSNSLFSESVSSKELLLEDLVAERFHSPEKMYVLGGKKAFKISQFPITVYRNRDERAWAEAAYKNFARFSDFLGGDPNEYLYPEQLPEEPEEDVPF